MLSALLSGTNAGVRISDADGAVIVERQADGIGDERFPIAVDGRTVGWVEGDRVARAIASVLGYAVAREADKRSLAAEALDRYRELNLVYDLAERLSREHDVASVATIVAAEAAKLPAGGRGFLVLHDGAGVLRPAPGLPDAPPIVSMTGGGIVGAVAANATAEEVNDVDADPRSTPEERQYGSLIAAPVVARGRTLGVLGAASIERVEYRGADLKLLAAIAAIAGPALAQARSSEGDRGGDAAPAPETRAGATG